MLLAIDVGNTNTVFALMKAQEAAHEWRIETANRQPDDYARELDGLTGNAITAAILSSVVPVVGDQIVAFCRESLALEALRIGSEGVNLGIKVAVPNPAGVGSDRLVNAVAGFAVMKRAHIIVDFGTATTFDVVDEEGAFCGGVIAPGAKLIADSLHRHAAQLPETEISRNPDGRIMGLNTEEAIRSGLFYGYLGLIEGIVKRLRQELGDEALPVLATGGLASVFFGHTPALDRLEPQLTVQGLAIIHSHQAKRQ